MQISARERAVGADHARASVRKSASKSRKRVPAHPRAHKNELPSFELTPSVFSLGPAGSKYALDSAS